MLALALKYWLYDNSLALYVNKTFCIDFNLINEPTIVVPLFQNNLPFHALTNRVTTSLDTPRRLPDFLNYIYRTK